VTDTGMKGRVKGLLGGAGGVEEHMEQTGPPAGVPAPHQALQVLNLAQRTAEEHIANARRQAEKIHADARVAADQIVREAQAHAQGLRQEADKALSAADAAAAQIARDAQAYADKIQRNAQEVLADAQTRAEELAKTAQADADELKHRAAQRYEDVVGSLASRREGLQQQIEALEQFDREYRARLTNFMQTQLRALWVDQPKMTAEIEYLESPAPANELEEFPPEDEDSDPE
jgi:vacuolar-type H+-ATPase subunit H